MKKYILLLFVLLLTSCSYKTKSNDVIYNLDISTYYDESISTVFDKNAYNKALKDDSDVPSLEYILLYEDQYPIFSNLNKKYDKEINKKDDIEVNLNYKYIENDFFNSNYIQNCFEHYNISSTTDDVIIELSGKFYCYHDKPITINVTTDKPVSRHNGKKNGKKYTWTIDKNNKDNVAITFGYNRFVYNMVDKYSDIKEKKNNYYIIVIIVILILFLLMLRVKRRDKK